MSWYREKEASELCFQTIPQFKQNSLNPKNQIQTRLTDGIDEYLIDDYLGILDLNGDITNFAVGYVRIDKNEPEEFMEKQISSIKQIVPRAKILKDIESNTNLKRPGLLELMKLILKNRVRKLFIANKKILGEIQLEILSTMIEINGGEVINLNLDYSKEEKIDSTINPNIKIIDGFECIYDDVMLEWIPTKKVRSVGHSIGKTREDFWKKNKHLITFPDSKKYNGENFKLFSMVKIEENNDTSDGINGDGINEEIVPKHSPDILNKKIDNQEEIEKYLYLQQFRKSVIIHDIKYLKELENFYYKKLEEDRQIDININSKLSNLQKIISTYNAKLSANKKYCPTTEEVSAITEIEFINIEKEMIEEWRQTLLLDRDNYLAWRRKHTGCRCDEEDQKCNSMCEYIKNLLG